LIKNFFFKINYFLTGIIYFETNQFEKAIVAYKKALEIKEDVQYLCKKGRCYLKLNYPKSALVCFDIALNLDPKYAQTYKYKGIYYSYIYNIKNKNIISKN